AGLDRAPDVAGHLEREAELPLLVLDRDLVAVVRAGKAALRAQAEVLERHVAGGRVDAAPEVVLLLELGALRADEPEHDRLALRYEPERLEPAGAIGVVLEEERLHIETREHGLGDRGVAPPSPP